MANRIMLNETSYHGVGAIKEIATEAKARHLRRHLSAATRPDPIWSNRKGDKRTRRGRTCL